MPKTLIVSFTIEKPAGVSYEDIASYVADAVGSMGGCLQPDDPLFHSLAVNEITINRTTFRIERE
jgi:hypothetical protein